MKNTRYISLVPCLLLIGSPIFSQSMLVLSECEPSVECPDALMNCNKCKSTKVDKNTGEVHKKEGVLVGFTKKDG